MLWFSAEFLSIRFRYDSDPGRRVPTAHRLLDRRGFQEAALRVLRAGHARIESWCPLLCVLNELKNPCENLVECGGRALGRSSAAVNRSMLGEVYSQWCLWRKCFETFALQFMSANPMGTLAAFAESSCSTVTTWALGLGNSERGDKVQTDGSAVANRRAFLQSKHARRARIVLIKIILEKRPGQRPECCGQHAPDSPVHLRKKKVKAQTLWKSMLGQDPNLQANTAG